MLLPALFAVMFLGMQAALIYHARTVAIAAAQEGARAAAGQSAQQGDGIDAASEFIADVGGDVLTQTHTTVTRTATTVTVTVTGHGLSVLPGWEPVVTQSASRPLEELTTPTDRGTP